MIKTKIVFFFLLSFLAGFLVGIKWQILNQKAETVLTINNQPIKVELAKTSEEIARGLSGREKLDENSGMLFVFNKSGNYPFWMKEMKFNLDAVFVNGQEVVDLAENIPFPQNNKEPQTFLSKVDFDQVLEVNSGMIKRLNIKIGDKIEILDKPE